MPKPGPTAMTSTKWVSGHLKGTTSTGLTYSDNVEDGDELVAVIDAGHAGDTGKGCSTPGSVVYLAGEPEDWKSVKQTVLWLGLLSNRRMWQFESVPGNILPQRLSHNDTWLAKRGDGDFRGKFGWPSHQSKQLGFAVLKVHIYYCIGIFLCM